MDAVNATVAIETARRGLWGGRLSVVTGRLVLGLGDASATVTVSRGPAPGGQALN